ncbi:polysulfide reductase NrfD [bacterium]|nr:polysulfide reductase NrfD [bacterium]
MDKSTMENSNEDLDLFRSIEYTGNGFYWTVGFLIFVIAFGLYGYFHQVLYGLGVTGMAQPISWGFYIVNFVFFIGISHAGTLISAILRLSQAEWRRPITRMAEIITAIVLAIGGLHPILDLGQPGRMWNLVTNGRLQSPLLWDVTSITAYFAASTVYLYLPMIPDIAILRDRGVKPKWLYQFLSWNWQDTPEQKRVLERAINILMIMVIPIAVSVHTVISYIFAMTIQPGWHSTIFGPYFVAGAIFSGIAALMIAMIAFRKIFHLERYLKLIHFQYLSTLLLIMSIIWFYFTFSEYLTTFYGNEPDEMRVFNYKFIGDFAPYFWLMVFCNFAVPVIILSFKKTKTIPGILVVSFSVLIGMWLERLIIVVPSLANPRLEYPVGIYIPTITEWGLFAAGVAIFILGFLMFAKYFPLISIWEIREGRESSIKEVAHRLQSYMPDTYEEDELERALK